MEQAGGPGRIDWVLAIAAIAAGIIGAIVAFVGEHTLIGGSLAVSVATNFIWIFLSVYQAKTIRNNSSLILNTQSENTRLSKGLDERDRSINTLEERVKALAEMHESDVQRTIAIHTDILNKYRHRHTDVAEEFKNLSIAQSIFDGRALQYFAAATRAASAAVLREHERNVDDAQSDLSLAICNAAARVIALNKKNSVKCNANIKVIERKPDADPRDLLGKSYVVLDRAEGAPETRYQGDKDLLKSRKYVMRHRAYAWVMHPRTENHYLVSDLEKVISEIEADPRAEFLEPARDSLKFYKSSLTVPILGEHLLDDELPEDRSYMLLGGHYVFGFLCVDAPETNYFDEAYDLKVLNQLAHNVFSMLRSYYAVKIITTRRDTQA